MAAASTLKFSEFVVKLGDGATPTEAFAAPCGFLSRALQLNKTFVEQETPDCSDEDAAAWVERAEKTRSLTISGQGVLDQTAFLTWQAWWFAGGTKNCQVVLTGIGTFAGGFVLSNLQFNAEKGGKVQITVELNSDGVATWTAA